MRPNKSKKSEIRNDSINSELAKHEDWQYQALRELVRDFAKREVIPLITEMEKEESVPLEILKKMGQLGFYGVKFPEKYGGLNLGQQGQIIVAEELAKAYGSLIAIFTAHAGLVLAAINHFGNEEQKQKWLVPGIKGEKIGAFALTEPDVGSDAASIKTLAKKEENNWILNGTKQFVTNGDIADFLLVFARTNQQGGKEHLSAFILEKELPGLKISKVEKKIGIKASRTVSLIFDNLSLSEENLLAEVGQGFKIAMTVLNEGRLSLAAGCLGMAKAALEESLKYSAQRQQFGQSINKFQIIQKYLAEMEIDIYAMESLTLRVAKLADEGKNIKIEAAIAKTFCSEALNRVADIGVQIHGGYGYIEDYPIARIYRDARVTRLFEGTSEIQELLIAKELIKSVLV